MQSIVTPEKHLLHLHALCLLYIQAMHLGNCLLLLSQCHLLVVQSHAVVC